MTRLLIPALAAACLAGSAVPAAATPWHGGEFDPAAGYRYAGDSIDARERRIADSIERGAYRGDLTRAEASRLRAELRRIEGLERGYRRSGQGLSLAERADLDRRLDDLGRKVFSAAQDRELRRGPSGTGARLGG